MSFRSLLSILVFSLITVVFLFWWIYFKEAAVATGDWVLYLPYCNVFFNGLTTILLILGYVKIKQKQVQLHKKLMISAFLSSSLFLVCYLLYHHYHGDTKFLAQGVIRPVYFFILISHILLSIVTFPMILITLYAAFKGKIELHKKIARWTFPLWLYVSVTGVLIVVILKIFNSSEV